MIEAAYGTVSDIELLWILLAAVGLGYSAFNVRDAYEDLTTLRRAHVRNGRIVLARTNLTAELARSAKQTIFLLVGVLAATLAEPPAVHLSFRTAAIGFLIRWGLIAASALTSYQSYLGYRIRRDPRIL